MPLLQTTAPSLVESILGGLLLGLTIALIAIARRSVDDTGGHLVRLLPMRRNRRHATESLAFVAGLLLAMPLVTAATGEARIVDHRVDSLGLALAGFAIGVGSRLAGGSLSRHALLGIASGSRRSLALVTLGAAAALVGSVAFGLVGWAR